MNFVAPFFVISLFYNEAMCAYDVVDYLTRFFERYDYSKIVYFVVDCDTVSTENAINAVKNLNSKWPGEKMNVITTAHSQRTGTTSTIFTSDLRQLEEALQRYSCNATLIYNNEPPRPETLSTTLSNIVEQMHYNETIFLFASNERSSVWPDELQRKIEDKRIQINAVVTDSPRGFDSFQETIRDTGGRIFTYRIQERRGWLPLNSDLGFSSPGYTYKLQSIRKDNLAGNSRIPFQLSEGTTNIILMIQGVSMQKALFVSPSGVMMNLLPMQTRGAPYERSSMTQLHINFRLPIFESPAEWTLSASGTEYNATMTSMVKTRLNMNGQTHATGDVYDAANTMTVNENVLPSYRSKLRPDEDQWTKNTQTNSAFMKRYDNEEASNRDQWAGNSPSNSNSAFMKRYDNEGLWNNNQRPDTFQSGFAFTKRYDEGGPSPYDTERSNKIRLTENLSQNAPMMKRYDGEGSLTYGAQNTARIGVQPSNSFNEPITNSISTIIDVDVASTFYVYPGEEARIVFNVRNNKEIPSKYIFNCHYMHQPCTVYPTYASLLPREHVQVIVTVRASGSEGSSSIVGLISMSEIIIDKKVYLFIGRPRSDRRKPDIDYEYNGNCDDANTGNTCLRKRWSANVVAQDKESGLLNFWSEPQGLIYTSEFIVGTKEDVPARYTASCCNPKVDILASDLQGNTYRLTLNVEHQYLSAVEIVAIILGGIILILLVSGIVFGIVKWRRRNRDTSFLKRSPTQRYNADQ